MTVGIPVHNGERYLARALDSHLAQAHRNLEILVSNNASTDRTAEILAAYAARDPRIRVILQPRRVTILENFLTVLREARGTYFMWAADDDQWMPAFVETLVAELEQHPDAATAMSAVELVTESGDPIKTIRFTREHFPNTSSYARMLRGATSFEKFNLYFYALYRTEILRRAVPGLVNVPGLDRIFICHLALAVRFRYVDTVLHRRTVRELPSHVRLPGERFNALKRERLADVKVLRGLASSISRSDLIPWPRKLLLPYAVWRYARLLAIVRAGATAKRHLPESIWRKLRNRIDPQPEENRG